MAGSFSHRIWDAQRNSPSIARLVLLPQCVVILLRPASSTYTVNDIVAQFQAPYALCKQHASTHQGRLACMASEPPKASSRLAPVSCSRFPPGSTASCWAGVGGAAAAAAASCVAGPAPSPVATFDSRSLPGGSMPWLPPAPSPSTPSQPTADSMLRHVTACSVAHNTRVPPARMQRKEDGH